MKTLFLLTLLLSAQSFAGNLGEVYLKELKSIEKIEKRGNNKLFTLIRNSSKELSKSWSPLLAKEVAVVFNKLLDANQNYFLVELIDPILETHRKEFQPILDENLSKKNKQLYKRLRKIADREILEGNG